MKDLAALRDEGTNVDAGVQWAGAHVEMVDQYLSTLCGRLELIDVSN
jgi:hypothetical protein